MTEGFVFSSIALACVSLALLLRVCGMILPPVTMRLALRQPPQIMHRLESANPTGRQTFAPPDLQEFRQRAESASLIMMVESVLFRCTAMVLTITGLALWVLPACGCRIHHE